VCANPLTSTDPTGKVPLGPHESAVCANNFPLCPMAVGDSFAANGYGQNVYKRAIEAGYTSEEATAVENAFRHAYWMALLTRDISCNFAEAMGHAHEQDGVASTPNDHEIDYWNNEVGREVGRDAYSKDWSDQKIKDELMRRFYRDQLACDRMVDGRYQVRSCYRR
jgi:hypothetical protein